jgi:hypothetical protein
VLFSSYIKALYLLIAAALYDAKYELYAAYVEEDCCKFAPFVTKYPVCVFPTFPKFKKLNPPVSALVLYRFCTALLFDCTFQLSITGLK